MRVVGRDLIRGGHYGQRSCEPHLKAEHMAAPTNAAKREESSCQSGAVHTWHKGRVSSSHFAYLPESCGVMSGYAPGVFSLASSCIWSRVLRAQLRLRSSLTPNFNRPSPSVSSSIVSPSMNGLRPR